MSAADTCIRPRKVVSASLFLESCEETAEKYWVGACLQALAVQELLPDYEFWVYINSTVPDYIQDALTTLRARVIPVTGEWESSAYGYFWRFLPFDDPAVERVYVCDVDLTLTVSEQHSIREWELMKLSVLYRPWYNPQAGPRRAHERRRMEEGRFLLACALGIGWPFGIGITHALRDFFARLGRVPVYGHDEVFLSEYLWPRFTVDNSLYEAFEEGITPGRDMDVVLTAKRKRRHLLVDNKHANPARKSFDRTQSSDDLGR